MSTASTNSLTLQQIASRLSIPIEVVIQDVRSGVLRLARGHGNGDAIRTARIEPEVFAKYDPALTVTEAARLLGHKTTSTVRRWIREGRIKGAYKVGRDHRVRLSVIREFRDSGRKPRGGYRPRPKKKKQAAKR